MIVASGTALAQMITFALMPVITRIYGPEAYGVLGTFVAFTIVIGPLAALTYPIAIVLAEKDEEGRYLIRYSWMISLTLALLLLTVLLLFHDQIITSFNLQELGMFLYFLPLVIVFTSLEETIFQWLIRTRYFKVTAQTAIFSSLIMNGSKVGFGLMYPVAASLIVIQTFGIAARGALFYFLSRRKTNIFPEEKAEMPAKSLLKKYKDFPLYRAPQMLLSASSQSLPILILASLSGPAAAGFYTLAKTALDTPVALLGKAMQDVFYPKVSEAVSRGENAASLLLKAVGGLIVISFLPFSFVIITGPQLFSIIFGAEWTMAGEFARWVALMAFAMLVTRPVIVTIPALGIQKQFLYFEILSVCIRIGGLALGFYYFDSDIYAVALFASSSVVLYILLTIFTWRKAMLIRKGEEGA